MEGFVELYLRSVSATAAEESLQYCLIWNLKLLKKGRQYNASCGVRLRVEFVPSPRVTVFVHRSSTREGGQAIWVFNERMLSLREQKKQYDNTNTSTTAFIIDWRRASFCYTQMNGLFLTTSGTCRFNNDTALFVWSHGPKTCYCRSSEARKSRSREASFSILNSAVERMMLRRLPLVSG